MKGSVGTPASRQGAAILVAAGVCAAAAAMTFSVAGKMSWDASTSPGSGGIPDTLEFVRPRGHGMNLAATRSYAAMEAPTAAMRLSVRKKEAAVRNADAGAAAGGGGGDDEPPKRRKVDPTVGVASNQRPLENEADIAEALRLTFVGHGTPRYPSGSSSSKGIVSVQDDFPFRHKAAPLLHRLSEALKPATSSLPGDVDAVAQYLFGNGRGGLLCGDSSALAPILEGSDAVRNALEHYKKRRAVPLFEKGVARTIVEAGGRVGGGGGGGGGGVREALVGKIFSDSEDLATLQNIASVYLNPKNIEAPRGGGDEAFNDAVTLLRQFASGTREHSEEAYERVPEDARYKFDRAVVDVVVGAESISSEVARITLGVVPGAAQIFLEDDENGFENFLDMILSGSIEMRDLGDYSFYFDAMYMAAARCDAASFMKLALYAAKCDEALQHVRSGVLDAMGRNGRAEEYERALLENGDRDLTRSAYEMRILSMYASLRPLEAQRVWFAIAEEADGANDKDLYLPYVTHVDKPLNKRMLHVDYLLNVRFASERFETQLFVLAAEYDSPGLFRVADALTIFSGDYYFKMAASLVSGVSLFNDEAWTAAKKVATENVLRHTTPDKFTQRAIAQRDNILSDALRKESQRRDMTASINSGLEEFVRYVAIHGAVNVLKEILGHGVLPVGYALTSGGSEETIYGQDPMYAWAKLFADYYSSTLRDASASDRDIREAYLVLADPATRPQLFSALHYTMMIRRDFFNNLMQYWPVERAFMLADTPRSIEFSRVLASAVLPAMVNFCLPSACGEKYIDLLYKSEDLTPLLGPAATRREPDAANIVCAQAYNALLEALSSGAYGTARVLLDNSGECAARFREKAPSVLATFFAVNPAGHVARRMYEHIIGQMEETAERKAAVSVIEREYAARQAKIKDDDDDEDEDAEDADDDEDDDYGEELYTNEFINRAADAYTLYAFDGKALFYVDDERFEVSDESGAAAAAAAAAPSVEAFAPRLLSFLGDANPVRGADGERLLILCDELTLAINRKTQPRSDISVNINALAYTASARATSRYMFRWLQLSRAPIELYAPGAIRRMQSSRGESRLESELEVEEKKFSSKSWCADRLKRREATSFAPSSAAGAPDRSSYIDTNYADDDLD